jgi:hypothetical protein
VAGSAKPPLPRIFPFTALGENNSPRHPSNLKDGSFAFETGIHDILVVFSRSQKAEMTMKDAEFDGFGEPILRSQALPTEPHGPLSRGMVRVGTGIFWAVVVAIVVARVAYFNPGFADQIAALPNQVLLALSVLWV